MATQELRTEPVFDALKQPLALVEDEARRRQIETYIEAARTPVERAVFDLMSSLVSAIDERLGEQYRVRLAYRPGGLELDIEEKASNGEDGARWSTQEGDVEKITIRIPAELKDLATEAAAKAGTSANTWFIKALARSLRNSEAQDAGRSRSSWENERHGRGSRMSGWVGGGDDDGPND